MANTGIDSQTGDDTIDTAVPNAKTEEAIENAKDGVGMSRAYYSVKELMDDLNSDGDL